MSRGKHAAIPPSDEHERPQKSAGGRAPPAAILAGRWGITTCGREHFPLPTTGTFLPAPLPADEGPAKVGRGRSGDARAAGVESNECFSSRSIPGRPTVSGCGRRTPQPARRTSRTDHGSFIRSARGGLPGNRPGQPGGRGPAVAGRATSQAIGRGREGGRDEAEQQLLKLGTTVLPLLPDAKSGSAEVQLRLGRVRQQLETARAEEEVRERCQHLGRSAAPGCGDRRGSQAIGQQAHRLSTRVWPASRRQAAQAEFR